MIFMKHFLCLLLLEKTAYSEVKTRSPLSSNKAASCSKLFTNRVVAYWQKYYYINDQCERFSLSSEQFKYYKKLPIKLNNTDVIDIKATQLTEFKDKGELKAKFEKKLTCKDVNDHFIISDNDVYYVEKCLLRKFKNYSDFENYKSSLQKKNIKKITNQASESELSLLKSGLDMAVAIEDFIPATEDLSQKPLAEVCKGLNFSKVYSYYSSLYKIEPLDGSKDKKLCQKKLIESSKEKPIELTGSQLRSIPNASSNKDFDKKAQEDDKPKNLKTFRLE